MLTIEQCRAARGLLGWTQQDLADASGLSKTAINNFEKGHSDIKMESLRAIRLAFENADIEFTGQDGLRKRSEHTKILRGQNALDELLGDIHETVKTHGGEILISHVDNRLSGLINTQLLFDHLDVLKKHKIHERVLCAQGTKTVLSPGDECRWLPRSTISAAPAIFIYGPKVAFELWDHAMIIILNNPEASNAERARFDHVWNNAEIPASDADKQRQLQS